MVYICTYCNFTDTILIFSHISTGTYESIQIALSKFTRTESGVVKNNSIIV